MRPLLLLALAWLAPPSPSEAAQADPCVAAQNSASARQAFLSVRPGDADARALQGVNVRWDAARQSCMVEKRMRSGSISYECREDDYGRAVVAVCEARAQRAAADQEQAQRDARRLAGQLRSARFTPELLDEYKRARAAAPAARRQELDNAFEEGLVRRMGRQRFDAGGREPAPTQLDQDLYAAWLQTQNRDDRVALQGAQDSLEARAREYEGTLRMQRQAAARSAEYQAQQQRVEQERERQAAEQRAAAARARQCEEFRQMQREHSCRPGSLNSVCKYAAQQLQSSGCN